MNYQILDSNGEIVTDSISAEELQTLIEAGEYNFFQYDDTPENDLVTRFAQHEEEGGDTSNYRIYKQIIE